MKSFPWDSIVEAIGDDGYPILDRACSAEELREVVETFFTNGVFMDTDQAFTVTPDEGMSVIVSPGKCLINGTVGYETSERKLALQGPSSQDRIDTIVLRWNANIDARLIDLYVRTGVAADVPTRPALVRNNTVYELGIQDIYVAANAGTVVQQRMTDTRLENERCGAVLPFASIDTTTFYAQIQAAIDDQIGELQRQTDRAVELAQSAIDGTTAGNLQKQIDANRSSIDSNYAEFDELRDSLSQYEEITLADGKIIARKVGSIVSIICGLTGYPLNNSWKTAATLPEGWWPPAQISDEAYSNGISTSYTITPSGEIRVIRASAGTSMVRFCCTYVAS